MARLILVSGLIPYDSGKTWFTLSTALTAKRNGLNVSVYKPVAGHSLWYSPGTIAKTLKYRLLVGNDISLYYEAGLVGNIIESNPVALATCPPDPLNYSNVEVYMQDIEELTKTLVLSRISSCRDYSVKHYIHPENLNKTTMKVMKSIREVAVKLDAQVKPLNEILEKLYSREIEEELDLCLDKLVGKSELVFIESFNDAIVPYTRLLRRDIDVLVLVAPSRILVYRDTSRILGIIIDNVEKYSYTGFKSMHLFSKIKHDYTWMTGFKPKPKPSREHVEFLKEILGYN